MGYMAHDAVIVTISGCVRNQNTPPLLPDVEGFRESLPEEWRPLVIGPVAGLVNDYLTYVFLPDGSKEGWDISDQGDEFREQFTALFAFRYEDGSSPFDVVHVRFGGDERYEPRVTGPAKPAAVTAAGGEDNGDEQ
jgi:hypothetical protein